jgi:hypothetical protein
MPNRHQTLRTMSYLADGLKRNHPQKATADGIVTTIAG